MCSRSVFVVVFVFLYGVALYAQHPAPKQVILPQEEVMLQKEYIEANTQKILGNYEEAAERYQKVVDKDKDNHAAYFELAKMYRHLKNLDKAIEHIKTALVLQPNEYWYHIFYEDLLEEKNLYAEAAMAMGKVIKIRPSDTDAAFHQATLWLKANQPEQAEKTYQLLEKTLPPNDFNLLISRLELYRQWSKPSKAEGVLRSLVKLFPENTRYKTELADVLDLTGKKDEAARMRSQLSPTDPYNPQGVVASAEQLRKNGDHIAYLQAIHPMLADPQIDIDQKVKELLPYLEIAANPATSPSVRQACTQAANTVSRAHAGNPKSFALYGDMLYQVGESKEALVQYDKALAIDKTILTIWQQKMLLLLEQKDAKAVIATAEQAMDIFPNQPTLFYTAGLAYNMANRPTDAIDAFEQALPMTAKNPALKNDITRELANTYFRQKQLNEASALLDKALKAPNGDANPMVLELYGDLLYLKNEPSKALEYWKLAQTKGNNSPSLTQKIAQKKP
jgi:tetratricopeptide (TPR) repeat protein